MELLSLSKIIKLNTCISQCEITRLQVMETRALENARTPKISLSVRWYRKMLPIEIIKNRSGKT